MLRFFGLATEAEAEAEAEPAADPAAEQKQPDVVDDASVDILLDAEEIGSDADKEIDPDFRYTGTVTFFNKLKGYGFVEMDIKDLVPNNTVFCHWQSIQSSDRYAFLKKGIKVEFRIELKEAPSGPKGMVHRAEDVSIPGGEPVVVQDSLDHRQKIFIGGHTLRYTGNLKFYDPKQGYGYITIDQGYQAVLDGAELRCERAEVNAGGQKPLWMSNVTVEFGIWQTPKGAWKAYNMTLPGGLPLTQAAMENRILVDDKDLYYGMVKVFNWKQGWGFIKYTEDKALPADVAAALKKQALEAEKKASRKGKGDEPQEELLYFRKIDIVGSNKLDRGSKVRFRVYTDDKGAGAHEITLVEESN